MKKWIMVCYLLLLCACGEVNNPPAELSFLEDIHPDELKNASGEQTEQSRQQALCVTINDEKNACSLATLGFIGQQETLPDKATIMSRVLVSHPWMADNFSRLLDQMPEDMYRLFASTTAIVIHSDIRPAFFWAATGAIYLDPYYLWMTGEQKATINPAGDYRSRYDDALSFTRIAQYSLNGRYPFGNGNSRTEQQALYVLSALLFHELAHANDYFPRAELAAADSRLTPLALAERLIGHSTSLDLYNRYPLQSDILYQLGRVQFQGEQASDMLIALTASDVGNYFAADGANDAYNYSTLYEDTAMLFEEAMMKIHYGIDREMAFATVLATPPNVCSNISLDWTAINRVLSTQVIHRAEQVVNRLLPDNNHSDFFINPPAIGRFSVCQAPAGKGMIQQPAPLRHDFWH